MPAQATSAEITAAIHCDRLAEIGDAKAQATCLAIGQRTAAEMEAVMDRLTQAGTGSDSKAKLIGDPGAPAQRAAGVVAVPDGAAGLAAAEALAEDGYRPWEPLHDTAASIHRRFRREITVARTTDLTMVVTLQWPGSMASRLPRALIPNENDFEAVSLPAALWPAYFLVRPIRLVAERLGLRSGSAHALGPFLSTPSDLVEPLLDLAGVGADDVVVDLGCGDGRILRAAVANRQCRAVGVESDPHLVKQARQLVADAGLADRITIVQGDAGGNELGPEAAQGTAYFVFVPAPEASRIVRQLLAQTSPGTRVIAHEQHPLPDPPPGATSLPLIRGNGITVAHRWTVGA